MKDLGYSYNLAVYLSSVFRSQALSARRYPALQVEYVKALRNWRTCLERARELRTEG